MSRATPGASEQRNAIAYPGASAEQRPLDAAPGHPLSVTAPYVDGRDESRPYVVTSRIASVIRTHRYSDPDAAARGAEQERRDLALLSARVDGAR
jgi:hypothetical protein